MKREGIGASGSEVHKVAELEACQRILEAGSIGARIYNGPNIAGAFYTRQDKLLSEMKWVAVDVYEQKKLAVAHCRMMSNMINKYWSERSRGSLSTAASMVQSYWVSIAKEIRAPLPPNVEASSTHFKLNTLQSMRSGTSPRHSMSAATVSFSIPASLLPSPMAGVSMGANGLLTPPNGPEGSSMTGSKKSLSHGMVHDWLRDRESQNPPLAEGTTGMADFSVQIVKHHLRFEDHPVSPRRAAAAHPTTTISTTPTQISTDFLLPVDCASGAREVYRSAAMDAVEAAVQLNISKQGVDGLQVHSGWAPVGPSSLDSRRLLHPAALEAHRSVLQELVVTNIMSRNPQLFSLAAAVSVDGDSTRRKPPNAADQATKRPQDLPGPLTHKHYFVSVIFSTFSPRPWESAEDTLLRDLVVKQAPVAPDWDLVATALNWRMKVWLGFELLRSGPQCRDRWKALPPATDAVPVREDNSKKKKISTDDVSTSAFAPVRMSKRFRTPKRWLSQRVDSKAGQLEVEVDSIPVPPSVVTPPEHCPLDRRGLYSAARVPTTHHGRQFFHQPRFPSPALAARGALTSRRAVGKPVWRATLATASVPPSTGIPIPSVHPPAIEEAMREESAFARSLALKVIKARRADTPKRAFSVEDMVRKNSAAVPGQVPLYISGQAVCPPHPSFANMSRIAEMTLGRLIASLGDNSAPLPPVPVSVETLFGFCTQFRRKYPTVFTSQHKVTKPSMPQLRPGLPGGTNKMVTRQQSVAASSRPVAPQQVSSLPPPSQPVAVPMQVVPAAAAATAPAGDGEWQRTRQRRGPRGGQTPDESEETAFMAAGGPSLYGQFNHRPRR